LDTR
jgi:hypothetical protein